MGVCSSDSSENIFYKNQFRDYKVLFTKEQLTEIFEKYDHDDNETLQLSEIESMIKDMLDAVLHKQISYLSGKANVRPLLKKFKKRIQDAKGNYKRHALRLQNAIDQDRDGKITKPEFTDFILNLQANRREGILGVIAAGDDGSLILTKKQYIKKKKKEGDLYTTAIIEERKAVKQARRSRNALAAIAREDKNKQPNAAKPTSSIQKGNDDGGTAEAAVPSGNVAASATEIDLEEKEGKGATTTISNTSATVTTNKTEIFNVTESQQPAEIDEKKEEKGTAGAQDSSDPTTMQDEETKSNQ